MNRLGLGTNNFRIIGSAPPPPPSERYFVIECIGTDERTSINYPIGTFQVGDRVTFTNQYGADAFGYISYITEDPSDNFEIFATGVNNANQCFDNTINFIAYAERADENIGFGVKCIPLNDDFYSSNSSYPLNYEYYYDVYWESNVEDQPFYSGYLTISGTNTINDYYFNVGGFNDVFFIQESVGHPVTYAELGETRNAQPNFGNTNRYSDNGECNYTYFLRNNSGLSFICQFDTGC